MKFWKYHVNGNDFILLESSHKMHPSQITMLCDRHKGIGADGILCVAEEEQVIIMRMAVLPICVETGSAVLHITSVRNAICQRSRLLF